MKWVTREKARVDRIACPWLISRFIDKQPTFLFVPKDQVVSAAHSTRSWKNTGSTTLRSVPSH